LTGGNLNADYESAAFTRLLDPRWVFKGLVPFWFRKNGTKSHPLDSVQHSISDSRLIAEP
jgi:hypothetical protein